VVDFRLNGKKQSGVVKVDFDVKMSCLVVYYEDGSVMKMPLKPSNR